MRTRLIAYEGTAFNPDHGTDDGAACSKAFDRFWGPFLCTLQPPPPPRIHSRMKGAGDHSIRRSPSLVSYCLISNNVMSMSRAEPISVARSSRGALAGYRIE